MKIGLVESCSNGLNSAGVSELIKDVLHLLKQYILTNAYVLFWMSTSVTWKCYNVIIVKKHTLTAGY